MKDGFVKVATVTCKVKVADVENNCKCICDFMDEASAQGIKVTVFPELCITGYTCQDLFFQDKITEASKEALIAIAKHSINLEGLFVVGLPLAIMGKLYNVAAVVNAGRILGIVPKTYLPNYNEFYEARHFYSGRNLDTVITIGDEEVPVKCDLIFTCNQMESLRIAIELCEDLWVPNPPSVRHALAGATVIANLSASDEITGKNRYRKELVSGQSARLVCAYLYASAGASESTQDVVYSGHNIIAENGKILNESKLFSTGFTVSEIDCKRLEAERRRMTTYEFEEEGFYTVIPFDLKKEETSLTRFIDPHPFVPAGKEDRDVRCEEILSIQAMGLVKRLEHIGCKNAVIGVSGGLDSTLALLVMIKAFDILGLDHQGIIAVTMPGFGTTNRTYDNAVKMIKCIGANFNEISIVNAVNIHFEDIGQDPDKHDITYENCQARERTQILMDVANKVGGIVVGTGDLSELVLGWATYNGDHMSMYAVNTSVPKTLVKHLVRYYADTTKDKELADILYDVLDTPVSPELLPPKDGVISQITEDFVGPYELHDFFIYQTLRCESTPLKIFRMAKLAFDGIYDSETILKWEKVFYKRFFSQQFKRSCLPDGPKVGSVALSPRGDLRMPSDACVNIWMKELEEIEIH